MNKNRKKRKEYPRVLNRQHGPKATGSAGCLVLSPGRWGAGRPARGRRAGWAAGAEGPEVLSRQISHESPRGSCHTRPLLKVTDPQSLALESVAAAGPGGSPRGSGVMSASCLQSAPCEGGRGRGRHAGLSADPEAGGWPGCSWLCRHSAALLGVWESGSLSLRPHSSHNIPNPGPLPV